MADRVVEVNREGVSVYLKWRKSKIRRPLYLAAYHYYRWHSYYVITTDNSWFTAVKYWMAKRIMWLTRSAYMREKLNRAELIAAGVGLDQYGRGSGSSKPYLGPIRKAFP